MDCGWFSCCASVAGALAHRGGYRIRRSPPAGARDALPRRGPGSRRRDPASSLEQPPDFSADLVLSLDADGRPGMGVAVNVPYQGLQWIRPGPPHPSGHYAAAIEIAVEFEPHGGKQLYGDVWERRLVVGSFDESRARAPSVTERRTFQMPPGSYQVTVTVHDLNAGTSSRASDHLTVPDYSKVPGGIRGPGTRTRGFLAQLSARTDACLRGRGPEPGRTGRHVRIGVPARGRAITPSVSACWTRVVSPRSTRRRPSP